MGLELNYIEGQTPINEDEKADLLIKSITTQNELNEFEQFNIEKAVIWIMNTKFSKDEILAEQFIKKLHEKMYGNVWKWAGKFRKSDKNIGVDWMKIGVELKNLLDDTKYWIEKQTYPPDEIAIRFKHRIVSIHCFSNGNGRHSRLMADIIIESVFAKGIFSWHHSNMVKPDEIRKLYMAAIHEADSGNIRPLIEFARS